MITLIINNIWWNLLPGIHTSIAKGTMKRNCHQDWLMGRCGRAQEAAGPTPRGKLKVLKAHPSVWLISIHLQAVTVFALASITPPSLTTSSPPTTSSAVMPDAWRKTSHHISRWDISRRERGEKSHLSFQTLENCCLNNSCSQVFGDLFSPTGECYPYNNYTVIPVERGLGRLMRRRQSRLMSRVQYQSCQEQR